MRIVLAAPPELTNEPQRLWTKPEMKDHELGYMTTRERLYYQELDATLLTDMAETEVPPELDPTSTLLYEESKNTPWHPTFTGALNECP